MVEYDDLVYKSKIHGKYPSDVETNGNPLYIAVKKGNVEIVRLLLSGIENPGINQIVQSNETYHGYFKDEYIDIKKTALLQAVEDQNIEIVKILLDNENIDPNIPYKYCRIKFRLF